MKKIIQFTAIAVLLCMALCSCNLSALFGAEGTDSPVMSAGEANGGGAGGDSTKMQYTYFDEVEKLDFLSEDMGKYLTVDLKGLSFEVSELPKAATKEDIDEYERYMLVNFDEYDRITDRKTERGDWVLIDYIGYKDGVAFAGGAAEDVLLHLDDDSGYIDGFADGLIGAETGKNTKLNLTFPSDYGNSSLAGQAVVFSVDVKCIAKPRELTDAIADKITEGEYKTAESFRKMIEDYLNESRKYAAFDEIYNDILEALDTRAAFTEVPKQQLDHYTADLKNYYISLAEQYQMTYEQVLETMQITEADLEKDVMAQVRNEMIVYYLVEVFEIDAKSEEIEAYVQSQALQYTQQGYKLTEDDYDTFRLWALTETAFFEVFETSTLTEKADSPATDATDADTTA